VEGTRARSGNTLRHKNGLLSYALELLFEGKVKDIQIVPVSISYERVLEAESFLPEILGKPKARESLSRILKGLSVFNTHYGRANVVFGAPSSARQLVEQASGSRFNVTSALGTFITNELNKNLVVMITHLVATALLSSPNPTSLESLGNRVDSLRDALITRNCLVDVPRIGPCAELIKKCLHSHFKDLVTVKNDHVAVKAGNSAPLTLAYYRNHLVGPIGLEAAISACFLSMSRGNTAVSVSESLLIEEALHLIPLLGIALQVSKDLIKKSIREMVHNDSLVRIDDKLKIHPKNTVSRILVSVIDPFVDCAWLTAVGIRWRRPADCDSIPVLSSRILELAQSMLSEKAIDRIEATSLETIKNTLQSFVHAGVIDMQTLPKFPDLDRIIHRIARLRTGAHRPCATDNYQALNSSEIETPAARL
jgi:glycerol-3-phosphate O-acyltransferase